MEHHTPHSSAAGLPEQLSIAFVSSLFFIGWMMSNNFVEDKAEACIP